MRQSIIHILFTLFLINGVTLLNACATKEPSEEAERLAARQASLIRQHLPIKSGSYTWVQAQNKGTVINITLINKDISPEQSQRDMFEHHFPEKMCEQPVVMALLEKGVTYQIVINPEDNNPHQFALNAQTCRAVHS